VAAPRAPVSEARAVPSLARPVVLLSFLSASACAHVPVYARERLAHPTMQLEDPAGPAEAHVNSVHEGAAGGGVEASSGCGCN
jgi:hypothetical protein